MIASRINHVTTCVLMGFAQTGTQAEIDGDTNGIVFHANEVMGSALSQSPL